MAAHRFGDPLTDGEIDRALATALAVDPSPEFVARVRMRICAARPSRLAAGTYADRGASAVSSIPTRPTNKRKCQ